MFARNFVGSNDPCGNIQRDLQIIKNCCVLKELHGEPPIIESNKTSIPQKGSIMI